MEEIEREEAWQSVRNLDEDAKRAFINAAACKSKVTNGKVVSG